MAKRAKGVNPELEKAISDLLTATMKDETASLLDKMRVIDRALGLEKIKQKISDDEWGAGFNTPDGDDEA